MSEFNETQKILLEQLQRHSGNYEECSKRGIVVDDLDVDSFIDECSKLVEENGIVASENTLPIDIVTNRAYCCEIWNGTTHWQECVIAIDMDEAREKVDKKYGKPMRTEPLHEFDLL